jgi:glycosyltransferase involved in cell wall biosynthesis
MRPKLVLAANDGWNIVNYRKGLIAALEAAGYDLCVIAPDGPHTEEIRQMGAEFFPISMSPRGTSPLADLRLLKAYAKVLRDIRPAALLGFTAKPNIYGSIAARLVGVPAINNVSGLGTVFARRSWLTALVSNLYRIALRQSAKVFFQNGDDRALFERMGLVQGGQSGLLPGSGVDLAHFAPVDRHPDGGPFTFLLAARLLWEKGVGEFVEAARRLRSEGLEARFQILGIVEPDSSAAVSRAQLQQWQDERVIAYLGSADDVRPAYASADCVVLPSYYREGVPRVLLEASAMGVPVITTDMPGCRDAVEDGTTGFLCEPRSVDSLTDTMTRMVGLSPDEHLRMGVAARAKMEREFNETLVHRAYLDALRQVGVSGS